GRRRAARRRRGGGELMAQSGRGRYRARGAARGARRRAQRDRRRRTERRRTAARRPAARGPKRPARARMDRCARVARQECRGSIAVTVRRPRFAIRRRDLLAAWLASVALAGCVTRQPMTDDYDGPASLPPTVAEAFRFA